MMLRAHDGALVGHAGTGEQSDISYLEELSRRLLELEAASQSDDPLATLARSVVAQARCTFCCCCGRALTDPVSVETGIGPECGATFHAVFRSRWRAGEGAAMTTNRVQLSRKKGWKMPAGAVKVDRKTEWGNPLKIIKAAVGWLVVEDAGGACTSRPRAKHSRLP